MKKKVIILIIISLSTFVNAQQHAIDSLKTELKKAKKINQAGILTTIAVKYYQKNEFDNFLEYSLRAFRIAKEMNQVEQINPAISNITLYYYIKLENDKALEYANQYLQINKKIENHTLVGKAYYMLYSIYLNIGDVNKQKEVLLEGLDYCKSNDTNSIELLQGLCSYYYTLELYDKTLEYANKSLQYAKKTNNKFAMAEAYKMVSLVYGQQKEYDKAILGLEDANKIFKGLKTNQRPYVINTYNLGLLYLKKGDLKKALVYFEKTNALSKEIHFPEREIYSLIGMADVSLTKNGTYKEALKHCFDAILLAKKHKFNHLIPEIHSKLAMLFFELKEYKKARLYFKKSNENLRDFYKWAQVSNNQLYLSKIDSIEGNYKNAFLNYQKYKKANDSIFKIDKNKEITNMQTQFEVQKKEEQITLLDKNLNLEKNNKKQLLYIFSLLISAISLGLFFFSYRVRVRKKIAEVQKVKLQTELDSKNRELASFSMHLQQKNTLLTEFKEKLSELSKTTDIKVKTELKLLHRDVKKNINLDLDWEKIKETFTEVYPEFYNKLIAKSNNTLSPLELKYCSYMKINISPKEIAQFLNIEPRSVYMSFYRIRKKLNVNAEEFMEEFILEKQLA